MEMHQIRYFIALCDELHFRRAARRCGVAQPSLTRAIKLLEKELGGTLFNRKRGNIRLSELGRVVAPFLGNVNWCEQSAKRKAADFNLVARGTDAQMDLSRRREFGFTRQDRIESVSAAAHSN